MRVDHELDTRGTACPIPILLTRKAVAGLAPGELLRVLASDPGSVKDMEAFCRQTGASLIESGQREGAYLFVLRKC